MRVPRPSNDHRREFGSYFTEFLEKGTQIAGAVKAGVEIGRTGVEIARVVMPYVRPLVLAAAL